MTIELSEMIRVWTVMLDATRLVEDEPFPTCRVPSPVTSPMSAVVPVNFNVPAEILVVPS